MHLDSRWTPENYLDSSGVHLEYVGQSKVLHVGEGGIYFTLVYHITNLDRSVS